LFFCPSVTVPLGVPCSSITVPPGVPWVVLWPLLILGFD
jgi:hypothetical protein